MVGPTKLFFQDQSSVCDGFMSNDIVHGKCQNLLALKDCNILCHCLAAQYFEKPHHCNSPQQTRMSITIPDNITNPIVTCLTLSVYTTLLLNTLDRVGDLTATLTFCAKSIDSWNITQLTLTAIAMMLIGSLVMRTVLTVLFKDFSEMEQKMQFHTTLQFLSRISSYTKYIFSGNDSGKKEVKFTDTNYANTPGAAKTQDTQDAAPTSTPPPVSPQSNTSSGAPINDLAQPEGAKEARDSDTDTMSDTVPNTVSAEATNYPSNS